MSQIINKINIINAPDAPKAVGPYSHAVKVGDLVFSSGNIPVDPSTSTIVTGGIEEQTSQVLKNIRAVLSASELSVFNVVKTTVFMVNLADFSAMNKVYAEFFGEHKPARSTVQVSKLPLESLIEIEFVASS